MPLESYKNKLSMGNILKRLTQHCFSCVQIPVRVSIFIEVQCANENIQSLSGNIEGSVVHKLLVMLININ